MSINATHQEALNFMFHCFDISKHISISVLFFCWIFENNCPVDAEF